jgi:hypothetical protein
MGGHCSKSVKHRALVLQMKRTMKIGERGLSKGKRFMMARGTGGSDAASNVAAASAGADYVDTGNTRNDDDTLSRMKMNQSERRSIEQAGATAAVTAGTRGMGTECKYCKRNFVSQHARDVHLVRNQVLLFSFLILSHLHLPCHSNVQ